MQPPSECLDILKCSICNRLLSIFPIYVMQDENNQHLPVCGRCELPDKEKYLRYKIYENLAKAALFPCINQEFGCLINLLPKDMKEHELVCPYKLQNCVINECDWEGMYDDALDHYETNHNDLILRNNTFNLKMNENYDVSNFLLYEDEIFTFKYNFDHILKHLMCSLTHLYYCDKQRKYYAQINLTTEDASMSKTFPEIDADKNVSKSININMANMLNDKNPTITATIKIVSEQDQLKLAYDEQINKIVLSNLKCGKCNGSMRLYDSVIYCCSPWETDIRHSNCSHAKNASQYDSVANDIVKLPYFRCEFGCEFIANIKDLVVHYKRCFNKSESCLLSTNATKCEWRGRRLDFVKHISKAHNETIINVNQLIRVSYPCSNSYFLKYASHMFRLIVALYSECLWRVEVLHSTEQSNNFKFELTIFNTKDDDNKIIIRERCADFEFCKNKTLSQSDTPCIFLRTDNIKDFIQNNTLSFKINIWK